MSEATQVWVAWDRDNDYNPRLLRVFRWDAEALRFANDEVRTGHEVVVDPLPWNTDFWEHLSSLD